MLQLYINDKLCELTGNEEIAIDYAIAKIGEIEKRTGSGSTEINLPKTNINRAIFESSENLNSASTVPYTQLKARILVDGIDQKITLANLTSINDTYNIRLYDANVDFFSVMKDRNVNELDLHHYDYFHRIQHVIDERLNTEIAFPIINNFDVTPNSYIDPDVRQIDIRFMPPAFGYEFLLEKITEAAGFTLNNLAKVVYKYPERFIAIPFTKDNWNRDTDGKRYEGRYDYTSKTIATYTQPNFTIFNTPGYDYNYYQNPAPASWAGNIIITDALSYNWKAHFSVNNATGSDITQDMRFTFNGIPSAQTFTIPAGASNYILEFTGAALAPVANGIYYQCTMVYDNNSNIQINSGYLEISNVVVVRPFEVDRTETISFNESQEYVTINSLLPDMKQGDLFKAYCQLTASVIIVDDRTKTVSIVPFKNIIDNISKFIDWSDKLDLSPGDELIFTLDDYAQQNLVKYADDETVITTSKKLDVGTENIVVANSSININNTNLPLSKALITLPFAATITETNFDGVKTAQISVWQLGGTSYLGKAQPRIIFVRPRDTSEETPTTDLSYTDGTTTTAVGTNVPFTHFIKLDEDFNLGFDNNILPKFYSELTTIINKAKIPTVPLRLNASDINQLDFTLPVYIKYYNAYFYISQIKEYRPGITDSTLVELVKLF